MLLRAIVGWLGILGVAILNGGLRDRFIRPRLGFFAAELFGAFILSAAILFAAIVVMRPALANGQMAAIHLSASWVVMTLAFEFLFFHYVGGRSWNELFSAYKFWEGRLWSVVVMVVAAAPFVAVKWLASRAVSVR